MPKKKVVKKAADKRLVTVHTCFSIEDGESLPLICACRKKIYLHQAKRWVSVGLAEWISIGKRTYHDKICIIGGDARRTPRSATIDAAHIYRAYVSDHGLQEQERINAYGQLNRQVILDLVKYYDPAEYDRIKALNIDRPVIDISFDDRTVGGIGKFKETK